ncbi:hypothetical protein Ancab_040669 [Ancistrocladus abbreviatus]
MALTNWNFGSGINVVPDEELKYMDSTSEALFARAEDVKTRIKDDEERHIGKRRKKEVANWLKNVEEVENKKRHLETDVEEGQLGGKKLKRQVEQLKEEMKELFEQGLFPDGVTLYDHSCSSLPLVTTQPKGQQEKNSTQILSWCDAGVPIIGVWGVGGVGKTTMVTHIHNELHKKFKTFGNSRNVYWVTVSYGITVSNLQSKIAQAMHSDCLLDVEDQRKRAAMLSAALKGKENSVLILDDVWEEFAVGDVGIPVGENGCKLILTSRSFEVCRKMACQKTIKVEGLSEEESWELFKENLGGHENLSSEAMDIAKLIAKECAGLPLAIVVIARSMWGLDDICEWRTSLEDLRKPTRQNKDMNKKVLQLLHSSYDRLNDEQLQRGFLYCALYPEDNKFDRDELVESWIRDGLMEQIESRQKQIDKGHTMINRLLEACLLEKEELSDDDVDDESIVKMHDVVRDMAVKVATENHRFMIRARECLRNLPREEEWTEDLNKISLMQNEMELIRPRHPPSCPNLQTFLLSHNWRLQQISDSFFLHMEGLMYLDLSGCSNIRRLPDSISNLENLRALVIRSCHELEYVPSLAKLKKLKELDMFACWELEDAPDGMEELVNLRYLNMGGSKELVLRWDLLSSKLSNLEDLRLEPSMNNIMVEDLMKLEELARLEGWWIRDIQDFNCYIESLRPYQLKHYNLFLGPYSPSTEIEGDWDRTEGYLDRTVYITGCHLGGEMLVLPYDLQELHFKRCDFGVVRSLVDVGVQSLRGLTKLCLNDVANLKALVMGGVLLPSTLQILKISICRELKQVFSANPILPNLKCLSIQDCNAVEEIFGGPHLDKNVKVVDLPKLTELELANLPRLRSICGGGLLMAWDSIQSIHITSCCELKQILSSIQIIHITSCCELKHILSSSPMLPNLKSVTIRDYDAVEEIFGGPHLDENVKVVNLPKLTGLDLANLPRLRSICGGGLLMACDSIQIIHITSCCELKQILSSSPMLPNLKSVTIRDCDAVEEIFGGPYPDENVKVVNLPNLTGLELANLPRLRSICGGGLLMACDSIRRIHITSCCELKQILSSSPMLPNLESMSISYCDAVEEIFGGPHPDENVKVVNLPELTRLDLANLPRLRSICGGGLLMPLDSIQIIDITSCCKLKQILSSSQMLPNLKSMTIRDCDVVEEIFGGPHLDENVLKLFELTMLKLSRLRSKCGGGLLMARESLHGIYITNCCELKQILSSSQMLSNLKSMTIRDCDAVEEIFGGPHPDENVKVVNLLKLIELELIDLPRLRSICGGGLLMASDSIQRIEIRGCSKLKQILSSSQMLPNLESMSISYCDAVEEIFRGPHPDENVKDVNLPKLTQLELTNLRRLRSICGGGLLMACNSIKRIYIRNCWELKTLPLVVHSPLPSFQIYVERRWWESLQWEWEWEGNDSPSKHVLQPFVQFWDDLYTISNNF